VPEPVIGRAYAWPSPYSSAAEREAPSTWACSSPAGYRELQTLQPVELGLRERRIQDHVGVDRERGVEILLQRVQAHDREVEIRAAVQVRAEARERIVDLQEIHARGAFIEHPHRHVRDAGRSD